MVELQSFYHHHFHPGHGADNQSKGRPPPTANYALPYDVLPVNRESSNVAIYGQRPVISGGQTMPSQSGLLAEPLYATTKPVANYNHFCQKVRSLPCFALQSLLHSLTLTLVFPHAVG